MTDRVDLENITQIFMDILEHSAKNFNRILEEAGLNKRIGFAVLAFDFGTGGNLGWISNANRTTMIEALKEFIEKNGGISVFTH